MVGFDRTYEELKPGRAGVVDYGTELGFDRTYEELKLDRVDDDGDVPLVLIVPMRN